MEKAEARRGDLQISKSEMMVAKKKQHSMKSVTWKTYREHAYVFFTNDSEVENFRAAIS